MSRPRRTVCEKRMYRDIDRGWAWVVLAAAYLGVAVQSITLYMSGVFYIELLERYGEGETKTSLVGSVSAGILCVSGPFISIINNKFSCRVSIVMGGVLTTLGFVLSAFVPNLDWMIFTSGVVVGTGYGMSMSGLVCVVGFYFEKWRDAVISFAFLTVAVGMFISAPLGLYLIGNYGLTETYIIVACMQAQLCVFGVICKPSVIENEVHAQKEEERACKESSTSKTYIDLTLLKDIPYMGFLCSTSTWNFGLIVAIIHLPNYVSVLGRTASDIGYLLSSFSVANLVGRLLGSLTISKLHHKSIYVHVIVLAITGVLSSLFPLYSKLPGGVYMFTIQLGLFTGWPNTMMTPLSLSFVGLAKLSEAYGLAYVFCGIGVTGPVLIGGVLLFGSLSGMVTVYTMRQHSTCDSNVDSTVTIIANENHATTLFDASNGTDSDMIVQSPLLTKSKI